MILLLHHIYVLMYVHAGKYHLYLYVCQTLCVIWHQGLSSVFEPTKTVSSTQFFCRFRAYRPHLQDHNEPATKCGITTGIGMSVRYRDDSRYQMVPGLSPPYSPYVMTWEKSWFWWRWITRATPYHRLLCGLLQHFLRLLFLRFPQLLLQLLLRCLGLLQPLSCRTRLWALENEILTDYGQRCSK